jgi:hypothetical protein
VDVESQYRLERDAVTVRIALEAAGGPLIHRAANPDDPSAPADPPGLYWAVIQPAEPRTTPFIARVLWTVYPDRPPSVLFATAVDGPTSVSNAWPAAGGYRAPGDICKPFTSEGQGLHPEWANGVHAWISEGNPFLYVIENLQSDIDRVKGARAA